MLFIRIPIGGNITTSLLLMLIGVVLGLVLRSLNGPRLGFFGSIHQRQLFELSSIYSKMAKCIQRSNMDASEEVHLCQTAAQELVSLAKDGKEKHSIKEIDAITRKVPILAARYPFEKDERGCGDELIPWNAPIWYRQYRSLEKKIEKQNLLLRQ